MVQFLGWLWSVAEKQFSWFGPDFWQVANQVKNFVFLIFQTVAQQIAPVQQSVFTQVALLWLRAVGFVNGVQATVTTYATNLHGIAINEIGLLGQRVQENLRLGMNIFQATIKAVEDTLLALINSIIGQTQILFMGLSRQLAAFVTSVFPLVESLIAAAVSPVRQFVVDKLAPLSALVANLEATIKAIQIVISILGQRARDFIVAFLSDPVGFLLALLIPVLLDVIFQLLAEKLGGVEAEIPPRPDWSDHKSYNDNAGFEHTDNSGLTHDTPNTGVGSESRG